MWQTVFAEFTAGPKADPVDLDRAEAELGFPLPESYRGFCLDCGIGLACGSLRIAIPSPSESADLVTRSELIAHSIACVLETREGHRFEVEGDDPSVVERACFFGETEAGEFLFWDVVLGADGAERREYEIWVMGADLESVRFGGADLPNLMRRLQGPAVRGILGMGAEPLPSSFLGQVS
ncbi:SMI1/KNR4 family protein [Methylobacterium sp. E-045]|uniref:SMI1/KNR4 family protein n=1 Tax=Methylobacterium sp. E-045 TaxID=2836575 RepID=UPI001FBA3996|nr:SMI1/KNR4 family protein [Methylobacterium sp. E-045]MCJ2128893.1 SMI1/KNR4 family protein [Methylobacterium sp. E-045]